MLDDLFTRLRRDAFGAHRVERSGRGGERDETTKPYEFGDPFHLDLRRTLANALTRDENIPGRRTGRGLHLAPEDFEVFRTELTTKTSTVLLVDMSRSMLLRGCFVAAKKVAVALDTLIRTQFPRDDLAVIGFAYYARQIRSETLAELSWHGYEYGTNLQHGLMLARRILAGGRSSRRCARSPAARRKASRSTRSCSSGAGRWPSSWRSSPASTGAARSTPSRSIWANTSSSTSSAAGRSECRDYWTRSVGSSSPGLGADPNRPRMTVIRQRTVILSADVMIADTEGASTASIR